MEYAVVRWQAVILDLAVMARSDEGPPTTHPDLASLCRQIVQQEADAAFLKVVVYFDLERSKPRASKHVVHVHV